jgi:hypothetical protein
MMLKDDADLERGGSSLISPLSKLSDVGEAPRICDALNFSCATCEYYSPSACSIQVYDFYLILYSDVIFGHILHHYKEKFSKYLESSLPPMQYQGHRQEAAIKNFGHLFDHFSSRKDSQSVAKQGRASAGATPSSCRSWHKHTLLEVPTL